MKSIVSWLLLCFLAGLTGTEAAAGASDGNAYYSFSKPDLRLCPSPLCGGFWIKAVNSSRTRCPDGILARDCYIAWIDAFRLDLPEEALSAFLEIFTRGKGIVKGSFQPLDGFRETFTLLAEELWTGQEKGTHRGATHRITDSGIRCITYPCPSLTETKLNTRHSRNLSQVDLDPGRFGEEAVEAGYQWLGTAGLIVSGTHHPIHGPGGMGRELKASQFFVPLVPEGSPDTYCGGLTGKACAAELFCDFPAQDACSGADRSGSCKSVPEICVKIYLPVCGCDGITYGNDCERLSARVQKAHEGECNDQKGTREISPGP